MKKKLRTIFSVFLSLLLTLVAVLPVSAASDFVVKDGVLTAYNGSSKNIVIPSDVYYIADSVFMNNKVVESVNLNGVSIIGNNTFSGCTSLKTVSGYEDLTSCGAYAFFGTPFQNNISDKSLVMGSVLVFSSASGAYTIPKDVKMISPYAFVSNTGITSVTVGDGVNSIGEGAFYGCTALKSVTVSPEVSYIGAYAFEGTKYLSSVNDSFLILGNGILVKVNSSSQSIKIPSNVKQVAAGAFYSNKTVTSVEIPDSVIAIGMRAFAECSALKKADLPKGLTLLDKEAFMNCSSLKEISIPASVGVIGDSVFLGCTALTTVKNLSSAPVSSGMFAGCSSLKYVMNSSDSPSVGSYAFYGCKSLQEISLPETVSSIHTTAFKSCSDFSVHCYLDSYAAEFCESKGLKTYELGDANSDKKLNIKDASYIQKATAGIITLNFSESLKADADLNGVVNIRDATRVQKELAGLI